MIVVRRLIEVALPIREISVESVRDKSLRHGHISTLHLWWARRPLAACRAVVFASLVPDPDDPHCPSAFRNAVVRLLRDHVPSLLKGYKRSAWINDPDPYRPYDGLPDTPRNRLLTFIAKWSPEWLAFEKGENGEQPPPDRRLDDRCLVKWETSDPANEQGRAVLHIARELVYLANNGTAPTVLDPFAGGGAIPLEATRLGCQAIANDYNPVAYLILRATCEFPQRYGKPGWRVVGAQETRAPGVEVQVVGAQSIRAPESGAQGVGAPESGAQASSLRPTSPHPSGLHALEPATTQALFDHQDTKKTRRNLPHWELEGRIYWITFATRERFTLPPEQRQTVLNAFHYWNGSRFRLHIVCVMPDHVHALIEPLHNHELSKILHSIKSFTANKINESLGRQGNLWQPESFDRIIRDGQDYLEKWEYIRINPVKDGLVQEPEQYNWLFADERVRRSSLEGCSPTWVSNVLTHDVEYWTKRILERARERIGSLYPTGKDGKPVIGYLWARTAPCSNPSCRAEIPLLRSLLICNKSNKRVALTMDVQGKEVTFGIAKDRDIPRTEGTVIGTSARCLICNQSTLIYDVKKASFEGKLGERIVAVIIDTPQGKNYRPIEPSDLEAFTKAIVLSETVERPSEPMPDSPDTVAGRGWNFKTWGSLFNPRQLLAMQTFVACLRDTLADLEQHESDIEYRKAVATYLGLWVSRNAMRMTTMGRWDTGGEKFQTPFDAQAIPMKWDYPEANPFSNVTGGFSNQLEWILHFLAHESQPLNLSTKYSHVLCSDGARLSLADDTVDIVVTDPPYFDAIAYADLSDSFTSGSSVA